MSDNKVPNMSQPVTLGSLELKNRFVMAPLTRCRATPKEHIPRDIMIKYYADRATAGLIISEATMVAPGHSSFFSEPGIYSAEQVKAWKAVTDAVHAKGGKIICQLCHAGRAAHSCNDGEQPVAPSAIPVEGHSIQEAFNSKREKLPYETPRELTIDEIKGIQQLFVAAAKNAIEAGFDGVQVHGANGYLLDEFFRNSANKRTDDYGGSTEKQCRMTLEVVDAVCEAIGAGRTAVRISPFNSFQSMKEDNIEALVRHFCSALVKRQPGLAFLDVLGIDFFQQQSGDAAPWALEGLGGHTKLLLGAGYDLERAEADVTAKKCAGVIFGTKFLANPDLPARAAAGAPLNDPRPDLFYATSVEGYNDYPPMQQQQQQ